jgi:hypothetical protein
MRRSLAVLLTLLSLLALFDVAVSAPAEAQSNPPIPRLRVSPECIADPGTTEARVRGSGFEPNSQVRLTFAPERIIGAAPSDIASAGFVGAGPPAASTAQSSDVVATVTADALGTFESDVLLTAPTALRSVVFGRTFRLDAVTVGGGPSSTAMVPSNCSETLASAETGCNAGNAGQAPDSVAIQAQGFLPGDKAVRVQIRRMGEASVFSEVVGADGEGHVRVDVDVSGYQAGGYEVVVVSPSDQNARAYFETPCPTLDIEVRPDCSQLGAPPSRMDVSVIATGFHANTTAWLVWDSPRAHEFWTAKTDRSGRLPLTISPYRRGAGDYSLRIRTDDGESAIRQRTVGFEVPCEPAVVSTAQTCGRPLLQGDAERRLSFVVSGSGFERGPVTVVFDAEAIVEAEAFATDADAAGRFSVTITPGVRPMGTYRIVAQQRGAGFSNESIAAVGVLTEAETSFTSPCRDREPPPPLLDPVCGPEAARTAEAYEIAVSGTGYYPNSLVIITFGRSDEFSVQAERDGSFSTVIQPSGKSASRVPVRAQQRDTLGEVAAGAGARFEVPCPIDPTIVIAPEYGAAGYTTTVSGYDFRPGTIVTLTWNRGITADEPTLVEVGEDGSFEVHVFILPNDWPGERTLRAGLVDEPEAFDAVVGTFTVTPGTGVPPGANGDGIVNRR